MFPDRDRVLKVLVLGGGGANGEFQLGVLEQLAARGCEFDFFTGVSTGAINASVLAQFASLADGVRALRALWDSVRDSSAVYATPSGGVALNACLALFTPSVAARDAIFGSEPLRKLIAKHVSWAGLQGSGKAWAVGTTSLSDGGYYLITNDAVLLALEQARAARAEGEHLPLTLESGRAGSLPDRIVEFVLASATMPLLFPPVDIYGHRFVDGALRKVSPLASAFAFGRTRGCTELRIVAISTSPKALERRGDEALDSGRDIIARGVEILSHEVLENDLDEAARRGALGPPMLPASVCSVRPQRDLGLHVLGFDKTAVRGALRAHGAEVGASLPAGELSALQP